jgi:GNAT superfamily N-acetyltransferase
MNSKIYLAENEQEILDCYPVMVELRPHIHRGEFVATVNRLRGITGYRLVYLVDNGIKAVAGFRISEWLASGKYLEIEELVAASSERSKGFGGELFEWLVRHARENGCNQVRLVSRVSRFEAHRFYQNKKMTIEAFYFSLQL